MGIVSETATNGTGNTQTVKRSRSHLPPFVDAETLDSLSPALKRWGVSDPGSGGTSWGVSGVLPGSRVILFEFPSARTVKRGGRRDKVRVQLTISPEAKFWLLLFAGKENPRDPRKALGEAAERAIGLLARVSCRELTDAERDALPDPPRVTRRGGIRG